MSNITPKSAAQSLYLDDIVIHEIILEAFSQLESELSVHKVLWGRNDISYRICNMAMNHELFRFFGLDKRTILDTLNSEYSAEIDHIQYICNN